MPSTRTLTVEQFAERFAMEFEDFETAAAAAGGVQVVGAAICVCQQADAITLRLDDQEEKPRRSIAGAKVLRRYSFYRGHVPPNPPPKKPPRR